MNGGRDRLPDIGLLFDLSGRVALVTGAAEGIGAEVARHLAGAGASVVLVDRNVDRLESTVAGIAAAGAKALAVPADLADETAVTKTFERAVEHFGQLDILVNNAGIHDRAMLLDTDIATWDRIQQINGRGAFLCLREATKAMIAGKRGGRIVNISSIAALQPVIPGLTAYAASKGGLNAMTRNAAFELAAHGILVNAVMPGGVATPGAANASGPPPSGRVLEPPLLGRTATAADIAAMVLFLAAPGAGAITGQCIAVDAGYVLG